MQIERVYVQAVDGVPEDEAFHKAWHGFGKRRIECNLVAADVIENGSLPLTRKTLVAGGIRTVESAIKQIGMRMPVPTICLMNWEVTLAGQFKKRLLEKSARNGGRPSPIPAF